MSLTIFFIVAFLTFVSFATLAALSFICLTEIYLDGRDE